LLYHPKQNLGGEGASADKHLPLTQVNFKEKPPLESISYLVQVQNAQKRGPAFRFSLHFSLESTYSNYGEKEAQVKRFSEIN
jgi:hypothetical protein